MPTLFRAADSPMIDPTRIGACFAQRRSDAERYLGANGFGGAHLYVYEVEPEYVLHLERGRGALVTLARELELEHPEDVADRWLDRGLTEVYQVIEDGGIERQIGSFYDWIVYDEPVVGRAGYGTALCRTWRYYGSRPMVGRLV